MGRATEGAVVKNVAQRLILGIIAIAITPN